MADDKKELSMSDRVKRLEDSAVDRTALSDRVKRLEDTVLAIGTELAKGNRYKLYTDDPMNLVRVISDHQAGKVGAADKEQLIQFSMDGHLFLSRRVPRNLAKLGAEESLASYMAVVSTMQLLTGGAKFAFTQSIDKADYVLFAGWSVSGDQGDANLWVHDPRKKQGYPPDFVGVVCPFVLVK